MCSLLKDVFHYIWFFKRGIVLNLAGSRYHIHKNREGNTAIEAHALQRGAALFDQAARGQYRQKAAADGQSAALRQSVVLRVGIDSWSSLYIKDYIDPSLNIGKYDI